MAKASVDVRDKRVLLIEGNAMMRRLIRDMLVNFRIKLEAITVVPTIEEAIEFAYQRRYDMIITDYTLGTVDAGDFAHHIRSDQSCLNRKTPILLVTTAPNHEKVLKALEAGVNEVLAKPIAPSALFFRLVSIWSRPRPFVISREYTGPSRSAQRLEALQRLARSSHVRREWRRVYRGAVSYPVHGKKPTTYDPFLL